MFQDISSMIKEENSIMKGVDPKIITILQLNAKNHMDSITDVRTELTLAALKREESDLPMHPTPNS